MVGLRQNELAPQGESVFEVRRKALICMVGLRHEARRSGHPVHGRGRVGKALICTVGLRL
jgi:hypothetical protein